MKRYAPALILIGLGILGHAVAQSCLPTIKEDVPTNNGIVILPGYPNAVAICGPVEDGYTDAIPLQKKNHALYINPGHLRDLEINELSKLATKHCNQLR